MMRNRAMLAFFILALVSGRAFGDVPPPPGFTAVGNALVLRASGDLSGYRFYLKDMSGETEEIKLDPASPTVIDAGGRGGPSRYAELWAAPRSEPPASEEGRIKLLDHNFQTEVTVIDAAAEYRDVYEISISGENGKPVAARVSAESGSSYGVSLTLVALAAAGLLIFAAIALLGLLLFWRLRKKRSS